MQFRRTLGQWAASERAAVEFSAVVLAVVGVVAAGAGAALFMGGVLEVRDRGDAVADRAAEAKTGAVKILEIRGVQIGGDLRELKELATAGSAETVNMATLELTLEVGGKAATFRHGAAAGPGLFALNVLRDADGSLGNTPPMMGPEDLVEITLDLRAAGLELDGREPILQSQNGAGAVNGRTTIPVPSAATAEGLIRLL